MENSVAIKLKIEDPVILESVYQTIAVEVGGIDIPRGNVSIKLTDNHLHLDIEAVDFVALRALSNSILRLVKISLEISETI